MSSIAARLREHFKTLPANALVSAYALRALGSPDAVYKFLSRETQAKSIERISLGVYRVNLTAARPVISNLSVMSIKSLAFRKDVFPVEGNDSKFRTNGCKSALKIGGKLVRWVPASIKKIRALLKLPLGPEKNNQVSDTTREQLSKFDGLKVSIFPTENDRSAIPIAATTSLELRYEIQKLIHVLCRVTGTNGWRVPLQQANTALFSFPYFVPLPIERGYLRTPT